MGWQRAGNRTGEEAEPGCSRPSTLAFTCGHAEGRQGHPGAERSRSSVPCATWDPPFTKVASDATRSDCFFCVILIIKNKIAWLLQTIPTLLPSQTLSGRDIEHHLASVRVFFYNDLVNGTVLRTTLGSQLLITSSQDRRQPVRKTLPHLLAELEGIRAKLVAYSRCFVDGSYHNVKVNAKPTVGGWHQPRAVPHRAAGQPLPPGTKPLVAASAGNWS